MKIRYRMERAALRLSAGLTALALALALVATSVAGAQPRTPRLLSAPVATSPVDFGSASQIVALRNGRLLVNDIRRQQILLLDSTLALAAVVLDSATGQNSYGKLGALLMPFRGDSSLVYEKTANTILVIDPAGKIARVMTPPVRGSTGTVGGATPTGSGGVVQASSVVSMLYSSQLGLVTTTRISANDVATARGVVRPESGQPSVKLAWDDSAVVTAMEMESRKSDTVAWISTGQRITFTRSYGGASSSSGPALFPFYDGVVVATDGSLAVLRSREYRVEWVTARMAHSFSPKLSYPWHRVTEDERTRVLDSLNAARRVQFDQGLVQWIADSASGKPQTGTSTTTTAAGTTIREFPVPRPVQQPALDTTVFAEIPDYLPPTGRNAIFADADNHVWLLPKTGDEGADGVVYDVVDRTGIIVDRIRVPAGRTIVGFAPGSVLVVAVDAGKAVLQKIRLRP